MIGKIILLFFMIYQLIASVDVKVDKKNVIKGDSVVFSIIAEGEKIKFPDIKEIAGYRIEGVSTSSNISIINGKYRKVITKSFAFTPMKDITIPSFTLEIDNKIEKTTPIKIKVVEDKKGDKNFKLEIIANKKMIVGYPNIVTIKFFQKTNIRVDSVALQLPKGDFILKQIGNEKSYYEGVYQVAEVKYKLIPLKEQKIDFRVVIKLGFREQVVDYLGFITTRMRYKLLSKLLQIETKKVYDGIVGDFKIDFFVDKNSSNPTTPVNGTLIIEGDGDFSNLEDMKIKIPNVTIYNNKPIIKNNRYIKKFVFISDKNYTIPAFSLKFYSLKEKQVKVIKTAPLQIEIKGDKKIIQQNRVVTKIVEKVKYKTDYFLLFFIFLIGVIIGFFISKFKVKKFKLPENLYQKLLPYADNPEIKQILDKLYKDKKYRLSKEERKIVKKMLKGEN